MLFGSCSTHGNSAPALLRIASGCTHSLSKTFGLKRVCSASFFLKRVCSASFFLANCISRSFTNYNCYTSLPLIEVIMPVLRATRRTVQLVTTPPDVRPRQHDKLDNTSIYNQDEFDVKRVEPAEIFNSYICQLAWCFDYRCSS